MAQLHASSALSLPLLGGLRSRDELGGFRRVAVVPMVQKDIVRWMVECGQCAAVVLDQMVPCANGLIYLKKPWMITVVSKSGG